MDPAEKADNLKDGLPPENFEDLAAEQISGIIYDRWVQIMNDFKKTNEVEIDEK